MLHAAFSPYFSSIFLYAVMNNFYGYLMSKNVKQVKFVGSVLHPNMTYIMCFEEEELRNSRYEVVLYLK